VEGDVSVSDVVKENACEDDRGTARDLFFDSGIFINPSSVESRFCKWVEEVY